MMLAVIAAVLAGAVVLFAFGNALAATGRHQRAADPAAISGLMRAEEAGQPTRVPIPAEIRRAVFERDGGRCVECGSNFDIQYDHILPVARGGATTVENLQLSCGECNRRKSDSL